MCFEGCDVSEGQKKHHVMIETRPGMDARNAAPPTDSLCFACKIICTAKKRKLKYIVEPGFYFAWSNLIDGVRVPQAPLRSEEPPGSYI